jgi:hypothetical protein
MTVKGLKTQTLQTADNVSGLVLLNTTSFSGVASQSVNDVFSATYKDYLLKIDVTSGSGDLNDCRLRLRVSGTDTTTNYVSTRIGNSRGSTAPAGDTDTGGVDAFFLFATDKDANGESKSRLDVISPFQASSYTFFMNQFIGNYSNNTLNAVTTGQQNSTTQFTGFTIIASVGNITGSVSVYGYNK